MALFGKFFRRRKLRKKEAAADSQYLDALEIIKESAEIYLDLLARAREDYDQDASNRLSSKLNSNFEYFVKNWDGDIKIIHTIVSNCYVDASMKRLKLE